MKHTKKRRFKNEFKVILAVILSIVVVYSLTYLISNENDTFLGSPSTTPTSTDDTVAVVNPDDITTPTAEPYEEEVEELETTWYFQSYHGDMENTNNQIILDLSSTKTEIDESYVYHESMPMIQNITYRVSFKISSTHQRDVQLFFNDTNSSYSALNKTYSATPELTHHSVEVTIKNPTSYGGIIGFNVGNTSLDNSHDIIIEDFHVEEVNNKYSEPNIKVNHTGYLTNSQKRAIFPYEQGDTFWIIDTNNNQVVYTGAIVGENENSNTNEINFYGDFSALTIPGTYKVVSQLIGYSHEFEIGDNLFDNILISATNMLSYQRCGHLLESSIYGSFAHDECHNELATIYGTDDQIDVSGGWHDAGDYGRYVQTGVKATNDLLLAYLLNPDNFNDENGTAESGNGLPDILDEVKIELDWLFKMQTDDGNVYDKVVTSQFADFVSPDEDNQNLYVIKNSSTSVAGFTGTMALASIIFEDIDSEYSKKALDAAILSYDFLSGIGYRASENPSDISAGEYRDDNDNDERYFAAAALYAATNDKSYLEDAKTRFFENTDSFKGNSWSNQSTYATFILLYSSELKNEDENFYSDLYNHLFSQAESLLNKTRGDGYFVSIEDDYLWGSNADIADNAIILVLANALSPSERYTNGAFNHIHYLLGRNALNISFVTDTGHDSPTDVHNRHSDDANALLPGALVGGPNFAYDDPIANSVLDDNTPRALCYVDDVGSYTTNEIAVYWNSAFVFLLSSLI